MFFSSLGLALPAWATEAVPTDEPLTLGRYVTTGTRTLQRINESPVRTELLNADEFAHAGARSFADAIELLPGIRVENNCQNCGTSAVLLLGLEGKYTTMLFDGVPLFSGLAAVYGLDQIPTAFIDRIEVVKGGGSAIYGGGAVGGVINLIGRDPRRSGGLIEFRYDAVKGQPSTQLTGLVDYVSNDARQTVTLHGQTTHSEPVDLNADGFSDLTKRDLQVLGARITQQLGPGRLRLEATRTVEFRRGGDHFELPDNLANISERIDTSRDAATIHWSAPVSPDFDYSIAAGWAYIDRATFYGGLFGAGANASLTPETSPGAGDNNQAFIDRGYTTHGQVAQDQFGFTQNWVYHLDAQFNRRWHDHHTSVGVQYFRETVRDVVPVSSFVSGFPIAPEMATGDTISGFLQDDWHLRDAWELVLGVRADQNSELSRTVFSPRASLRWTPHDALIFRTSLGTGFRAPQPFDEDLHIELIAGDRTNTLQSTGLTEERSTSALLGMIWNPPAAAGRLTLETNAFYTQLRGTFTNSEIQIDPTSGDAFRTRFNGPDAAVGGVEVNVGALPWPALRVDFGFVAQFARFDEPVTLFQADDAPAVTARRFMESPTHYGVGQTTYTTMHAGTWSVSASYTGSMQAINQRTGALNNNTPAFLVWSATWSGDLRLGALPALTFTAGVKNIFDARQSDLESGVARDPYYFYGPRTPRTLFASARLTF